MANAPGRSVGAAPGRGVFRVAIGLSAGLACGLGAVIAGSAQQSQPPAFRASVDVVAVDVQVTDRVGLPVTGLVPADFQVTINGRRRRILSAQFITRAASDGPMLQGPGPYPTNEWPEPSAAPGSTPARTFVLAVDAASISPSDVPAVIRATRRFVSQVPRTDRIGVITLPFGTLVQPTIDRGQVWQALATIPGLRQIPHSAFQLSLSEMIDLSWQAPELRMQASAAATAGGRGEGNPLFNTSDPDSIQSVQQRECERDPECLSMLIADAESLAYQIESNVSRSLTGLTSLLALLHEYPGRKTVIVLSAGMPVSDRPGGRPDVGHEIRGLGTLAARANAVVYAVHLDYNFRENFSAQARTVRNRGTSRERYIESKLLEDFTNPSGGALLSSVADDGELAFDRILRETSGYYLLGVEAETADRDGQAHPLRVKVDRRGVDVRSRQWVVITRSSVG